MFKPTDIINKRKILLEELEAHIDGVLKEHFENGGSQCNYNLLYHERNKFMNGELDALMDKYRANGWDVIRDSGCDDLPGGSGDWDYIQFSIPFKGTK